jgi:hypothetical protein
MVARAISIDVHDLLQEVCDPQIGTAWIHTDGTMTTTGNPELRDHLAVLIQQWNANGRPRINVLLQA